MTPRPTRCADVTFYRNGIYEALRQSSPEVEKGKPIALSGQDLLDMTAAVVAYLDSIFEWPSEARDRFELDERPGPGESPTSPYRLST